MYALRAPSPWQFAAAAGVAIVTLSMFQMGLALAQGRRGASGANRALLFNGCALVVAAAVAILSAPRWPVLTALLGLAYLVNVGDLAVALRASPGRRRGAPRRRLHRTGWAIWSVAAGLVPVLLVGARLPQDAKLFSLAERPTVLFAVVGTVVTRHTLDGNFTFVRSSRKARAILCVALGAVGLVASCGLAVAFAAVSHSERSPALFAIAGLIGAANAAGIAFIGDQLAATLAGRRKRLTAASAAMFASTMAVASAAAVARNIVGVALGIFVGRGVYAAVLVARQARDPRQALAGLRRPSSPEASLDAI